LFFGTLICLILLAEILTYEPEPHPLVGIFLEEEKRSQWLVFYPIFLAAILGPFCEEIFFRGFCYPIFRKKWGVGWGMVLSSLLFALIHYNDFAFLPIFILGMGLAFIYEKRKCLIASITLHVVHNSLFIAYFFTAKQLLFYESGG
ncbi:CPBP family intramembrane glutamic endopeptidase, partial [Streptococcus pseudopneumoniae]|uniref:CPBP family intramembrane glutamic endopeptidase n=1 Tax=Streptococcus pseudopneumoniae TaxID=257758 RepID=UPI00110C200B